MIGRLGRNEHRWPMSRKPTTTRTHCGRTPPFKVTVSLPLQQPSVHMGHKAKMLSSALPSADSTSLRRTWRHWYSQQHSLSLCCQTGQLSLLILFSRLRLSPGCAAATDSCRPSCRYSHIWLFATTGFLPSVILCETQGKTMDCFFIIRDVRFNSVLKGGLNNNKLLALA